jgi:CheY-like chemotaxis protein
VLLVVDDDKEILATMQDLLEEEGYSVRTAADGVEAVYAMAQRKPRMILLDLMMPHMTGWEVLEAMKADPALADIPVCVATGRRHEAPPKAATYVLQKPFTVDELLEVVRQHC